MKTIILTCDKCGLEEKHYESKLSRSIKEIEFKTTPDGLYMSYPKLHLCLLCRTQFNRLLIGFIGRIKQEGIEGAV